MSARFTACYLVRSPAGSIAGRADAIAVEQSVEMPVGAIGNLKVLTDIVGRVEGIEPLAPERFRVRIGLSVATTGLEAGQLLNILFGNSSIHDDVVLEDVIFPPELAAAFPGPSHGLAGLRRRVGAEGRAMTCSALKPQGLTPADLARIAGMMVRGGVDFIKDDHGLADQGYSPFADRVRAVAEAVAEASEGPRAWTRPRGGTDTAKPRPRYAPSLSGSLDDLRRQIDQARDAGVDTLLVAPMVLGVPVLPVLVRENPDMAFITHPALAGACRIAPPLLLARLFRLFGADATVFPNHGGRFGYSPETCRTLAENALTPWHGLRPCCPIPAGGMTLDRVPEMLSFYGPDVMLLIGGNLLAAGDRLTAATANFTEAVMRAAAPL